MASRLAWRGGVALAAAASLWTASCRYAWDVEVAPALAVSQPRGLLLRLASGGAADVRTARMAALFVPAGEGASPFLPAGPFTAVWEGQLEIALRDRYRFSFAGRGTLRLEIGGKVVLEGSSDGSAPVAGKSARLKKGKNTIRVHYTSPASGAASMRLFWQCSEFAAEPVPPTVLSHDGADPDLLAGAELRRGRELFATLQCAACHATGVEAAMPEMATVAPSLVAIGARVRGAWLARWIADPHAERPGARMPKLVDAAAAADIAAHLVTLGAPRDQLDGDAGAGAKQFLGLGCIACHAPPAAAPDPDRISLRHVGAKWYGGALAAFLREPTKHAPSIRMPNLGLSEREAADLAAYLSAGAAPEQDPAGDAARGAQLLARSGCLQCHGGLAIENAYAPRAAPKNGAAGCLASDAAGRGRAPVFALEPDDRAALAALVRAGPESLARTSAVEFAERRWTALRCNACHGRDGERDLWSTLGEAVAPVPHQTTEHGPALAQTRPDLTHAGGKLQATWIEKLLRGALPERTRPWLRARMPAFPADAPGIARGFAMAHGLSPEPAPEAAVDPERVAIGAQLVGATGGFACGTCHAIGAAKPMAVFEVQGTNLALAHERLRKGYFMRWMNNPLRIDPGSRMPRYAAEGKTGFIDVLDGDAAKQFDAMWQYLRKGRGL